MISKKKTRKNSSLKKSDFSSAKQPICLFGKHAVFAALQHQKRQCFRLLVTANIAEQLAEFLGNDISIPIEVLSPKEITHQVKQDVVHQGIVGYFSPLPNYALEDILDNSSSPTAPLLLLDQITDPHNIGAILRSAAAFGVGGVILTEHHAPSETGIIAKAASGALEMVPLIRITNLAQAITILKKHHYWCVGLDGYAEASIRNTTLPSPIALVLGAEGKGLRRLTKKHCDLLVKLPISAEMESLNVSNAAAISLYELYCRN